MASSPITSQQIDGEMMETVTDFIFLGSKIMVDSDCNHEIKSHMLLGRKAMINLESVSKSRHYFADKGPYSQTCGFSSRHLWMWELDHNEGWVLKNPCFWTVVLEKTFESPLDWKEIKPVNLKGNQPWILLKLQYFGPLMWRANSVKKDPDAGKDESRRRRRRQRMRWSDGITDSMDMSWSKSRRYWRTGKPGVLQSMGSQRVGHNWMAE